MIILEGNYEVLMLHRLEKYEQTDCTRVQHSQYIPIYRKFINTRINWYEDHKFVTNIHINVTNLKGTLYKPFKFI